jgi:hypothetical protein
MAFFKKVIDKLAGGPPNEKALKEREGWFFLSRYKFGLYLPLAFTALFLSGDLVGFYLNPAPRYEDLVLVQGKVISVRAESPEFVVHLADGQNMSMEWPGRFAYFTGKAKIHTNGPYTEAWNNMLNRCDVIVKGIPMRGTFTNRFRIWEVDYCNGIKVDYERINESFIRSKSNSMAINLIIFPIVYILCFILFLRERRGHL